MGLSFKSNMCDNTGLFLKKLLHPDGSGWDIEVIVRHALGRSSMLMRNAHTVSRNEWEILIDYSRISMDIRCPLDKTKNADFLVGPSHDGRMVIIADLRTDLQNAAASMLLPKKIFADKLASLLGISREKL